MSVVIDRFRDSIEVKEKILSDELLIGSIETAAGMIISSFKRGGKLIIGGNGGSASDSLHFAGEMTGRFQRERNPWPAIVLGADLSTLTAIANDYGYEEVFARQAKALVYSTDVVVGISTSGNSRNLLRVFEGLSHVGCKKIGLLGCDGGKLKALSDCAIVVPSDVTARIQESHITIIHIICEMVEDMLGE